MDNLSSMAPPASGREEAEMKSTGAVSSRVYGGYFKASGHALLVVLMAFVALLAQLLGSASDWWTSYW